TITLWLFLGAFGVHRFYLGFWKTGLAQLALGILTYFDVLIANIATVIWYLGDMCMLCWLINKATIRKYDLIPNGRGGWRTKSLEEHSEEWMAKAMVKYGAKQPDAQPAAQSMPTMQPVVTQQPMMMPQPMVQSPPPGMVPMQGGVAQPAGQMSDAHFQQMMQMQQLQFSQQMAMQGLQFSQQMAMQGRQLPGQMP
ncbi:hypothetical protein KIPB_004167, partial [Kipferlia bialata]